jgi:N-ethylmaleimide reductase
MPGGMVRPMHKDNDMLDTLAPADTAAETGLLSPISFGPLALANRAVMAPMTRTRADDDRVPTPLMADYYAQRASAGLIVTECIAISPDAAAILRAPGLYTDAQVAGWKAVTDAVHAKGGKIFAQIWHPGRASHASLQPGGLAPIAPSAIRAEGMIFTPEGRVPFSLPRALEQSEIAGLVRSFADATARAKEAGFDGVELHGAFGYIVDQFLQDATNQRSDDYGGPVENRARFLLEVIDAMSAAWSADRVGVKLSPSSRFYGMRDSDTLATFSYAIKALAERGILYIHLMEPDEGDFARGDLQVEEVTQTFRPLFPGTVIANGRFDKAKADRFIALGLADLVSFGRAYVANPDLVERFAAGAPLNAGDPTTFYGEGPGGYTDYPAMK